MGRVLKTTLLGVAVARKFRLANCVDCIAHWKFRWKCNACNAQAAAAFTILVMGPILIPY